MASNYFGDAQYFIPSIFEECFTYEMQINYLTSKIEDLTARILALETASEGV